MKLTQIQEAKYYKQWKNEVTQEWFDMENSDPTLADIVGNHAEELNKLYLYLKLEMEDEIANSDPEWEFDPDLREFAWYSDEFKALSNDIEEGPLDTLLDMMMGEIWSNVPDEFLT